MDDHPSRRSCRLVLVAIAALVALAVVPAAGAHARLITTEPANDAVLEQSPGFVLLRFDEPVETAFGAIRVYDAQARRVDAGQGRAAARDGGSGCSRPAARPRHLHGDVASGLSRWPPHLRRIRLPRRGAWCKPGGDRRPGARERNAGVGVGALLGRTGARLPPSPSRRRRHAVADHRARGCLERDAIEAVASARGPVSAARCGRARGDRAPGRGSGRLRPP